MTNPDKLKALIQKATDNGFVPDEYLSIFIKRWHTGEIIIHYGIILFNHDFAKVLFQIDGFPTITKKGYEPTPYRAGHNAVVSLPSRALKGSWQYHLQQAVISEDPISYMYTAVFGND